MLNGRGGDDQIGIATSLATLTSGDPQICSPIKDCVSNREDQRMTAECEKSRQRHGRVPFLVAADHLKPCNGRKGELTVRPQILLGLFADIRAALLEHFLENIRIQ